MANENHNSSFDWKIKLEELENLHGETAMNKNAVWEKLYQRFEEKPHHNKTVWYWAAAACVIAILATSVLIVSKKENNSTATTQIKIPQSSANNISPLINKNNAAIIVTQKPVIKNQTAQAVAKKKNRFISSHHNTIIVEPVAVETNTSTQIVSSVTISNIPAKDSAIKLLAAIPEKKKLRVVQINELDNTTNPDPSFLADSHFGHRRFSIKLNGSNDFSIESFASSNLFDNSFKINLFPKN